MWSIKYAGVGVVQMQKGLQENSPRTLAVPLTVYKAKTWGATLRRSYKRLREFCTDESGHVNEQMLLNISRLAYQTMPGMVMTTMAPGQEHLAPFQHVPSDLSGTRVEYDISKDEQANVTVATASSSSVGALMSMDDDTGMPSNIPLDAENSQLNMRMAVALDAQTCEPTLNTASVDYAFPGAPG